MNNAELAAKIAGDLFGGNNDHAPKAGHLRLYTAIGDDGRYMAGWSEKPMATRVEALLDEADMIPRAEVAAALSALESDLKTKAMATVADGKFSKIGHGINIARVDLKATIAALTGAGVLAGHQKLRDALAELGDFDADIYTRAADVIYDLRAELSKQMNTTAKEK